MRICTPVYCAHTRARASTCLHVHMRLTCVRTHAASARSPVRTEHTHACMRALYKHTCVCICACAGGFCQFRRAQASAGFYVCACSCVCAQAGGLGKSTRARRDVRVCTCATHAGGLASGHLCVCSLQCAHGRLPAPCVPTRVHGRVHVCALCGRVCVLHARSLTLDCTLCFRVPRCPRCSPLCAMPCLRRHPSC